MNRRSHIVSLVLASLLAASSLGLAACGGEDGDSNRQASGGPTEAWSDGFGVTRKNENYRGIEVKFINHYALPESQQTGTGETISVSVAAAGTDVWEDQYGDLKYYDGKGGMEGSRDIPYNQYGLWQSRGSTGEILFSAGPDGTKFRKTYKSELTWPLNKTEFSFTNPAAMRPRFWLEPGCLAAGNRKRTYTSFSVNQVGVYESANPDLCAILVRVKRLSDSADFIRFTFEVFYNPVPPR